LYQSYIFFFQAEDGIRDFHVTGVQTCALPIYRTRSRRCPPSSSGGRSARCASTRPISPCRRTRPRGTAARSRASSSSQVVRVKRSEERRVGKEGGNRW